MPKIVVAESEERCCGWRFAYLSPLRGRGGGRHFLVSNIRAESWARLTSLPVSSRRVHYRGGDRSFLQSSLLTVFYSEAVMILREAEDDASPDEYSRRVIERGGHRHFSFRVFAMPSWEKSRPSLPVVM